MKSDVHNKTILDSRWTKIGFSIYREDNLYLAVVNFSSGILYSTSGNIHKGIYIGQFIDKPFLKSNEKIEVNEDSKTFSLEIKNINFRIIRIYNEKWELMDIVEVFF